MSNHPTQPPPRPRADAYRTFLVIEGVGALCFALVFTVNMVYQAVTVGLSPFQLVLVGTVLETTVFVFEVPTGVIADTISRRLSIIIGLALIGVGFLVEGLFPVFGAVLLSQVLWGLGATFTSGATQAWIADEVGDDRAGDAFMRGMQVAQVGGLIGLPLSAALGTLAIAVPIVLGGAGFVLLSVYLLWAMPETGFAPVPATERTTWGSLRQTFSSGLRLARGRPILLTFLAIATFFGLASESFDRLYTPHFIDTIGLPNDWDVVIWFAIISAAARMLSLVAVEIARRRVRGASPLRAVRLLWAINALGVAAIAIFGLAGSFVLALAAYLAVRTVRSVGGPLMTAWINPHIESGVRATTFSLAAQLDAIGQIAGGPGIGWLATRWSLRAGIVSGALLLSPVLVLFGIAARLTARADTTASGAAPAPVDAP